MNSDYKKQGAEKIIFTAYHSGKLKLAFTRPDIILTSPKNFLAIRIDFTVLLLFEFLKKHHLPIGQVKNRIHQPKGKIHYPWAIGHYFLCVLKNFFFCNADIFVCVFITEYFSNPDLPSKVELQVAELNSRLKRTNRS